VVCWNIATMHEPWRILAEMDADVALLQEVRRPPDDVAARVDMGPEAHWDSHVWNSRWWESRFDNRTPLPGPMFRSTGYDQFRGLIDESRVSTRQERESPPDALTNRRQGVSIPNSQDTWS